MSAGRAEREVRRSERQLRRAYGDRAPGTARRWRENERQAQEALIRAPQRRRAAFALWCRVNRVPPLDLVDYYDDRRAAA